MIDLTKFGMTVTTCRKDKGYTQDELASRLGVTPQAVSKWERGVSLPDTDILPGISKILDISIDDLLAGVIPEKETVEVASDPLNNPCNIRQHLLPDEVCIEFSPEFCVDNMPFFDDLLAGIKLMRKQLAYEHGLSLLS